MTDLTQLLAVARGDAPADLVFTGGQLLNVFTGEITSTDVAIFGDRIAAIGSDLHGRETVDLEGFYIAPGLIDGHVHIESSLCIPGAFASAVLPCGVTTVIADPHEIANVAGVSGIRYMSDASQGLPLNVVMMGPSCVPASPLATAGAEVTAEDLARLHGDGVVHGVAEVMNFPGVVAGDPDVLGKVASMSGHPVDGHCPGLVNQGLNAYIAAGIGSDHECITAEEAKAKLERGLVVLIREASNARNLDALLPVVTPANARRVCFCTDDRTPSALRDVGSIDEMVRRAIAFGLDPVTVFRMATLNTAEWFGLRDVGAVAPGRRADLFIFSDLDAPKARMVYAAGQCVAHNGRLRAPLPAPDVKPPGSSCVIDWDAFDPAIAVPDGMDVSTLRVRVIGTVPGQLVTEPREVEPKVVDGKVVADIERDLLKMAVLERHGVNGKVGMGLMQGFELKRGAIAGTIAHDHHNLVLIGCDDASLVTAGKAVTDMGGGLAVCDGEKIVASLALPIAGLMSGEAFEEVAAGYDQVVAAAHALGSPLEDPFMAMSFMALEVIPSLKLTDLGLVDVDRFALTSLFVD